MNGCVFEWNVFCGWNGDWCSNDGDHINDSDLETNLIDFSTCETMCRARHHNELNN